MDQNLEALNTIFTSYKRRCNKLENATTEGVLRIVDLIQVQNLYNEINETGHELARRLSDLEDAFPEDEEGNIVPPIRGEPGYRFNPEAAAEVKQRMKLLYAPLNGPWLPLRKGRLLMQL